VFGITGCGASSVFFKSVRPNTMAESNHCFFVFAFGAGASWTGPAMGGVSKTFRCHETRVAGAPEFVHQPFLNAARGFA
jgi:hypothetical protein